MLTAALIILPLLYAFAAFHYSAWQTKRRMARNSSPLTDAAIQKLNDRLAEAAELRKFTARIYEISTINGLAMPDGKIYITRGLFKCYRRGEISDAELSSVVAHELAHVMLGHTKNRLADFVGQNAARIALGFLLNRYIPFFGNAIAQGLLTLFSRRLSQKDEYAADAYASAILTKSGIGTEAQKSLLRKLPDLTGNSEQGIAWLMSHPKTEARITAIEKREQRWRSGDGD
ncbi:MAG: M48 family metallopeptidase [Rhodobacteraceae bacterium]|nr:M48 family metallopeptidase [Paracoccaceae bacterium]